MGSIRKGSIHLFRFAGIDVFLHWSWFLVAIFEINTGSTRYSSVVWNAIEYLALFAIVLLHEYGHALACRQVGGRSDHIVLWPLGGVAYVDPPPRPGATLWSIAAGPLVNVVLLVIVSIIGMFGRSAGLWTAMPNVHALLRALWYINFGLLIFNMLPIYPLDGGHGDRICRRRRSHRFRRLDSLRLVRHYFGFYSAELLVRTATGASSLPAGEAAAAPWICLPNL